MSRRLFRVVVVAGSLAAVATAVWVGVASAFIAACDAIDRRENAWGDDMEDRW